MRITRKSIITGVERTLDLPVSQSQWVAYTLGASIQNAMPHLSADEREFILTGVTKEEWDAALGPEE